MKVLMLDIAHDLRAKRLWPVALILVIAIVALPLVLLSGSGEPVAEAPAPAAPATPSTLPTAVKLTDKAEGGSSKLDEFDAHNPFRPKLPPEDESAATGGEAAASTAGGEGSATAADTSAGAAGSNQAIVDNTADNAAKAPKAEKAPKVEAPKAEKTPKSDDSTPTPTPTNDTTVKPASNDDKKKSGDSRDGDNDRTRLLSYEIDAAYGPGGKAKSHTLREMDVFPSKRKYFIFSGMSDGGREAVFTVLDDTLTAEKGQGHCKQVNDRCQVLYLRDGQERRFKDARGNSFVLRLGDVNLVEKAVKSISGKLADTVDKLIDPLR